MCTYLHNFKDAKGVKVVVMCIDPVYAYTSKGVYFERLWLQLCIKHKKSILWAFKCCLHRELTRYWNGALDSQWPLAILLEWASVATFSIWGLTSPSPCFGIRQQPAFHFSHRTTAASLLTDQYCSLEGLLFIIVRVQMYIELKNSLYSILSTTEDN